MNLTLAQENLRLSYQFLSWRRIQYFLLYIRREQNMDSVLGKKKRFLISIWLQVETKFWEAKG